MTASPVCAHCGAPIELYNNVWVHLRNNSAQCMTGGVFQATRSSSTPTSPQPTIPQPTTPRPKKVKTYMGQSNKHYSLLILFCIVTIIVAWNISSASDGVCCQYLHLGYWHLTIGRPLVHCHVVVLLRLPLGVQGKVRVLGTLGASGPTPKENVYTVGIDNAWLSYWLQDY